jgi:hypothetical protein
MQTGRRAYDTSTSWYLSALPFRGSVRGARVPENTSTSLSHSLRQLPVNSLLWEHSNPLRRCLRTTAVCAQPPDFSCPVLASLTGTPTLCPFRSHQLWGYTFSQGARPFRFFLVPTHINRSSVLTASYSSPSQNVHILYRFASRTAWFPSVPGGRPLQPAHTWVICAHHPSFLVPLVSRDRPLFSPTSAVSNIRKCIQLVCVVRLAETKYHLTTACILPERFHEPNNPNEAD